MVAGDDGDPFAGQVEEAFEAFEEVQGLVEFLRACPLGEVAGDDDDLRTQVMVVREAAGVVLEALQEGVEAFVGAEAVVASELDVGEVEDGDRRGRHGSSHEDRGGVYSTRGFSRKIGA